MRRNTSQLGDITLVVAKWGLRCIRNKRRSELSGYELTGGDFIWSPDKSAQNLQPKAPQLKGYMTFADSFPPPTLSPALQLNN